MSFSELCKTYATDVPEFLRNRPTRFVKHCMDRLGRIKGMVVSDSDEGFMVHNPSSGKDYRVVLEILACECPDFARNHWPCKHILAVVSKMGWETLPESFLANPMFRIDVKCLEMHFGKDYVEHSFKENRPDSQHDVAGHDASKHQTETLGASDVNDDEGDSSDPLCPNVIPKLARSCREKLKLLYDLTFLMDNSSKIQCLFDGLEDLSKKVKTKEMHGLVRIPRKSKRRAKEKKLHFKKTREVSARRKKLIKSHFKWKRLQKKAGKFSSKTKMQFYPFKEDIEILCLSFISPLRK